ncbi:zinc finger protein 541-like [Dermacentor albipictus]|uniref:zinc finger protein 541-like n=1 Tax=Dermacentor albipictus TaxID=60249 RepID=UPI0038FC6486
MSSSLEAPSPPPPSSSPSPAPQSAMTVDFSAFGLSSFVGGTDNATQALYLFPEAAPFSPKDQTKGPSSPSSRAYDHAGDAMLSAINYGEDEVLHEGFEVPFGSLDGLLRLPPRPATAPADPSPFDLLGDSELQLSPPQAFGAATHAPDSGVGSSGDPTGASLSLPCISLPSDKDLGRLSPALSAAAGMRPITKVGGNGGRAPSAQPCPVCGKVFGNSSALTKHKLTHSDERKYVCSQCHKAFKRQDHLNGHLLTHRNKKPYECDVEGCDKSYCDARSLRRHKENHHASVALTLVPFQAIPLPPQLQLVAFPSEDGGTSVWAPVGGTGQRPLLVAPTTQGATVQQAPPPQSSQQEVQQQTSQRQPSPRPSSQPEGPPLLQQLLEPNKTWTTVPAVPYSAEAINEPSQGNGGSSLSSALDAVPMTATECLCSLCHQKLTSLSELEQHMRLHQPPATTATTQSTAIFTQGLQGTCQSSMEPATVSRSNMAILQPDEVATSAAPSQQRPVPLLPPLNTWAIRPARPLLTSTNNERRRHSDSDHLAFEGSSGLLADLLLGPRRTSRVGSDPGLEPLPSFEQLQGLVASSRSSLVPSPDGMQSGMSYGDSHQHEDVFAAISNAFDEEEEKPNKDLCSFVDNHSPRHGGLGRSPVTSLVQSQASFGHEVVCVPDSPPLVDTKEIKSEPTYEQMDIQQSVETLTVHRTVENTVATTVSTIVHSNTPPPTRHPVAPDVGSTQPAEALEGSLDPKKPVEGTEEVSSCRAAECDDDDVFLSPIPTCPLRSRRKHRPEPLYIPPHVNAIGFPSRLRSPRLWDPCGEAGGCKGSAGVTSPPPYTPPPMLSPLRSGSGLFWNVFSGPRSAGAVTPHAITPRDRVSAAYPPPSGGGSGLVPQSPLESPCEASLSEEERELAPETDILPHVNVGPQFQARLPPLDAEEALKSQHHADLVWDPRIGDHLADDEVENYLELACCAAIPGGGRNREYAFHILALCQGNLQEATLRLMEREPRLPGGHPLLTYRYPECHRWSREEMERFQDGLATFDKDFLHVATKVGTKNVQQCVEFYYVWKKVAPEEYRRLRCLRRRRELDQAAPEEDDMEEMAGSPSAMPAAMAKPTVPSSEPVQPCEPPQEFPCRLCGRVFAKVKSRNAHMKSHGAPRSVASSRFEF